MSNLVLTSPPSVLIRDDLELLDELIYEIKAWDDRRYDLKWEIIQAFRFDEDSEALPDDIQVAVDLVTEMGESLYRVIEALAQRRETAVICDDKNKHELGGEDPAENEAHGRKLTDWLSANTHLSSNAARRTGGSHELPDDPAELHALKLELDRTLAGAGLTAAAIPCILLSYALYDLTSAISDIRRYCAELDRQGVPPELMSKLRSELGGAVSIRSGFSPERAQATLIGLRATLRRPASA